MKGVFWYFTLANNTKDSFQTQIEKAFELLEETSTTKLKEVNGFKNPVCQTVHMLIEIISALR